MGLRIFHSTREGTGPFPLQSSLRSLLEFQGAPSSLTNVISFFFKNKSRRGRRRSLPLP